MVGFKPADVPPTATVKLVGAGTAACIADLFHISSGQPAKVRLQVRRKAPTSTGPGLQYRGVFGTITTMVRTEGPLSFASVRVGLYDSVKQFYAQGSEHVGIGSRILAGCTTGAMAVAVAQPTDVVKVRFRPRLALLGSANDTVVPLMLTKTIARQEGLFIIYSKQALVPTSPRNAIVNCSELMNLPCHFTSAFGAGFAPQWWPRPVDVVKTRYMNSSKGQYGSALDCALAMLTKEGPKAFYKGFMPSFLRLGSWNVVMFVTYEKGGCLSKSRPITDGVKVVETSKG
uniref:Mitochondrial uncoupling protein 2 n=1 Tax=Denticeps clupeoides TaxID=299321 RepID=A0AAY4BP81_9TELE